MARPVDSMWAGRVVSGIHTLCPELEDIVHFETFGLGNVFERASVLDMARRSYHAKRPAEQPLAALDNGAGKKAKKPKVCHHKPAKCDTPPYHVPNLCPHHKCLRCNVKWNALVERPDGTTRIHGQNCPQHLVGATSAAAIAKRKADTAARKVASTGLGAMPVAADPPVVHAPPAHVAQQQQAPPSEAMPTVRITDEVVAKADFSAFKFGRGAALTDDDTDGSVAPGSPQYDIPTTELKQGRYYVGERELQDGVPPQEQDVPYMKSLKTFFTQKFPPDKITRTVPVTGTKEERAITLQLRTLKVMYFVACRHPENRVGPRDLRKGIDNVRGGPYTEEGRFSEEDVRAMTIQIDEIFGLCTTCHRRQGKCACRRNRH